MRISAIVVLVLSIHPVVAGATDRDGNYAIWGMGRKTCYSYSMARAADDYAPYKDYLMGYLTAFNAISQDTYRISGNMNLDEILEWIDDYCETKQMNSFDATLSDFISEHMEKRMKTAPRKSGR